MGITTPICIVPSLSESFIRTLDLYTGSDFSLLFVLSSDEIPGSREQYLSCLEVSSERTKLMSAEGKTNGGACSLLNLGTQEEDVMSLQ